MEKFTGKVWLLGDDIDTDIIMPTEYLVFKTIEEMNERLAYSITPVQEYLKSHTLLDGYTTAPIAIQKVIYDIRRSKHKFIPKQRKFIHRFKNK